jgi:hypothetical protein
MKLALLLFGNSKFEYVRNGTSHLSEVDYRKSVNNYKKYIYGYFERLGYEIDVYLSTNAMSADDKRELLETYKPKGVAYLEHAPGSSAYYCRNAKLNTATDLCLASGVAYDLVFVTRFDLLFQKDFAEANIALDKFNVVSLVSRENLICDNVYLFPHSFLRPFSIMAKLNIHKNFHTMEDALRTQYGDVNFMWNESGKEIAELDFYKIVRGRAAYTLSSARHGANILLRSGMKSHTTYRTTPQMF